MCKVFEITKVDSENVFNHLDESYEYIEFFKKVYIKNLTLVFVLKKKSREKNLKNLFENMTIFYKNRGFKKVIFV